MENTVLYWNRFNLSLPGRIKMSNTFLLSLINHLGCFIMPQEDQIEKMQKIIDNFCVGTHNCAKGRLYTFPSHPVLHQLSSSFAIFKELF